MRGDSAVILWVVLALVLVTGSCAVWGVLYLPYAERMVGCIGCGVLEVGDPDAKEWSSLEAGAEYVLVGCSTFPTHQVAGIEWFVIGNAREHTTRPPHEVAVRMDHNEWRGSIQHIAWDPHRSECSRMLVRYEGTLDDAPGWEVFVALDQTDHYLD